MAIKKSNVRIWITIPKTTKLILDKLQPLLPDRTQSEIVNFAIITFGEAIIERSYQLMQERK